MPATSLFFFFRAALSSERFAKTFPAELSSLSRLVDRCRSRYNDRNILVLIVNDTCSRKVTRTYRLEKKKKVKEKGSKAKGTDPSGLASDSRRLTSRTHGDFTLSINGLHRRHINRPKSDYRGIERASRRINSIHDLRYWRQRLLLLLPPPRFDSNKEDVSAP